MTTYTDLKIELEFSNYNKTMIVEISDNQGVIQTLSDVTDQHVVVNHRISLPSNLNFVISNKNYNTDTLVSPDGKILADKYVKLNNIYLGRMLINPEKLYKICCYDNDQNVKTVNDTYWGFNGVATINFSDSNFIKYLFLIDNKFKHK